MDRASLLGELEGRLRAVGCEILPGGYASGPDLLVVHPTRGLIVLDVALTHVDARVTLNRKVQALRADFPVIGEVPLARAIVALDLDAPEDRCLDPDAALTSEWWATMPERLVSREVIDQLKSELAPDMAFYSPRRGRVVDDGSELRQRLRVDLDLQQSSTAKRDVDDVLVVTGPPGSGKSLVLAARARWLASRHPDWNIEIVCFNKMLVPYLAALVEGTGAVVGRMSDFLRRHEARMSFNADEARGQLPAAKRRAAASVDALLVDEWQDLHASFVQLLLEHVVPGRGGALLVGDPTQALYGAVDEDEALNGHVVERVALEVPYRSSSQILQVAAALDPALDIPAKHGGLEGQPVDIVFANDKKQQAAVIARDVRSAMEHGGRAPENIAVLVLRTWDVGVVAKALETEGVPFSITRKDEASLFKLSSPTVKVMTAHSSKGYEFDVIFLMGIEQLPAPENDEELRHGRSALVALTRAKDQVVITYSKENVYLNRLRGLPVDLVRPWVWPDDYPAA